MSSLKEKIHQQCEELVDQKITMHRNAMNEAQEAANKEERSTAGDKYDTARAMNQNERDMYASRLAEVSLMKKVLKNIDPSKKLDKVESGALVSTENGEFYISVSCGQISVDGKEYFAISPITPIGQAMLDKSPNETFEMRDKKVKILKIS